MKIDKFYKSLIETDNKKELQPFRWEGTLEDGAIWTAKSIRRNEAKETKRFKEIEVYIQNGASRQVFYFDCIRSDKGINREYIQALFDNIIFKDENYMHKNWR